VSEHDSLRFLAIRNEAIRMARLYSLLYCFENAVRELIQNKVSDADPAWWTNKVPKNIRDSADSRLAHAQTTLGLRVCAQTLLALSTSAACPTSSSTTGGVRGPQPFAALVRTATSRTRASAKLRGASPHVFRARIRKAGNVCHRLESAGGAVVTWLEFISQMTSAEVGDRDVQVRFRRRQCSRNVPAHTTHLTSVTERYCGTMDVVPPSLKSRNKIRTVSVQVRPGSHVIPRTQEQLLHDRVIRVA
jgi:hypothetical protein